MCAIMFAMSKKGLSTNPYKGVRDFYPQQMAEQNYIFSVWKKIAELYGYEEYSASVLEPTELYKAKSGEEIINEQTYSFKDRGDREVTLRPEMTPTVARLVAGKRRELGFPLRWYSIPNLFRYEREQRGRLREHWQLNVDCFGATGIEIEAEIIEIADAVMKGFGGKSSDYRIKISHSAFLNNFISKKVADAELVSPLIKLIDRSSKIETDEYISRFKKIAPAWIGDPMEFVSISKVNESLAGLSEYRSIADLAELLLARGISVEISPLLTRGFDYYTGMIFEVYDTNPKNSRSLFGGGRYDNLLEIFGGERVPSVGFGMGDVTIRNFLEERNLFPGFKSTTDIYIGVIDSESLKAAYRFAKDLRSLGVRTSIDSSYRKGSDQKKSASKLAIPYFVLFGSDERDGGKCKVSDMNDGTSTFYDSAAAIAVALKKKKSRTL